MKLTRYSISLLISLVLNHQLSVAQYINKDSLIQISNEGNRAQQLSAYTSLCSLLVIKDFNASIEYGLQGLDIARQLNDSLAIGELCNHIGEAQYFSGNYDSAARYFYTSVDIYEHLKEKKKLAAAFNNIAKLYRKTRELGKAENYYNKAMDLYIAENDSAGIEMIWNESGVVFEYRGDYTEAIRRYSIALDIAERSGNEAGVGYALNNISGAYLLQKKYPDAEKKLLRALALRHKLNDSFALAINYSDLASLYIAMKEHLKASKYLDTSILLALRLKYPQLLEENYKKQADIYLAEGDYKQAYNARLRATTIADSIFNAEKSRQVEELNTKYQTEKKEQQIAVQQLEISRKNYLIIAISIILLLGIALGYSMYRRYKLKQEKRLQDEIMHQQQTATRAILEAEENERQRIGQDLHDGVGQMMSAVKINLSALSHQLPLTDEEKKHKFDNIMGLVDESCNEVRAISHSMMPNALLKAGLGTAIRDFLNKLDNNVLETNIYTEGLDERIDTTTETIVYRVIQECVNNVIKHAHATSLDISVIRDVEGISATVEDNGNGFDINDPTTINGIGLKNIRSRVEYLNGTIEINSRPGHGTAVIINIPG